ncbi:hypothetical protein GCM10022215_19390 [Nocardioides fonticola]|uniref:SCP domain-containing protein n=1 Tax=Nocardioides fonticola TaxID=450363 RepID=A0ABP7XJ13_9ACTN
MHFLSPRSSAAVAAACSVLVVGLAGPAAAATSAEYQKDGIAATNHERTSRSIKALTKDSCLQKMAVKQARKEAKANSMFHQSMNPIMQKCGMNLVGENVAYGFSSGQAVVNAWMNSPEHKANILESRFTRIGFGARQSASGVWFVSEVFGRPE